MTDIETQREEMIAHTAAAKLTGEQAKRYEALRSEGWSAWQAMQILTA